MGRLQTSWDMAKRSWAVLRADGSLLAFPIFSCIGSVVVFAAVAGAVALSGVDDTANGFSLQPMGWVLIAVGYVLLALVQSYFLAALVVGADAGLRGSTSTVSGCLSVATSRLGRLLPWAVVSATVTAILNQLERYGIVGRIVASLVGLAWNLVTFLTVPIIVLEDVGVGHALKRSKDLFRSTWGENVVGQAGLGLVGFVLVLPAIALIVLGAALGTVALIAIGIVAVVWMLVVATVMSALGGIYRTALYHFAVGDGVPGAFAGADFQGAFRAKRKLL